ncbi:hypothetical protein CKO15_13755 [Halorhodospira abdelmalekii]|uniref:hypothetical protein n=1 Tax=Halorhodospira abdelmalekii TaxID=421629 RepID=UPI001906011B|nr:hypothetical protein [Halorhodospira abdelmalekii]MBK1736303.1 hypothetical protein [Halorhodospira abdelmalekii]
MNDRDYLAAHTYVSWQDAENILRNAGNRKPSVDDVIIARARMRYAEADAMLVLRAERAEADSASGDDSN